MPHLDPSKYLTTTGGKKYAFANYPTVKIYKSSTGTGWYNHLLFGDYITISDTEIKDGRVKAYCRGNRGWVKISEIQTERVLEVNFIDIGQGDGCHVVTPDDRHILVDAGETDNMIRYLVWRFNLYRRRSPLPFPFEVVISHGDKDHYKGFEHIFEDPRIRVSRIFHNGLVERPGENHALGKVEHGIVTSLISNTDEMLELLNDPDKKSGRNSGYIKSLKKVLGQGDTPEFKRLSADMECMEGYDGSIQVNGQNFKLHILGPTIQEASGKSGLPMIDSSLGKTKNGHSIILKLVYDKVRILMGGDINEEAGEELVSRLSEAGKLESLEVDAAKACHHGSMHFHYPFLEHLNAAATIISSGDEENFAHPRPDALGAMGKCGYGDKPLIFSTELARSSKEMSRKNMKKLESYFDSIREYHKEAKELKDERKNAEPDRIKDIDKRLDKLEDLERDKNNNINSFLTKYGMINLRTDGKRMLIAQKLEKKAGYGKWDYHTLEYDPSVGRFVNTKS